MLYLPTKNLIKNILDKVRNFFIIALELEPQPPSSHIQFIKSKKAILEALAECKENGKAVGLYCEALGEGMFLTSVDDIFKVEKENIVVLKPYDMYGIFLQRTHLSLDEIRGICPFNIMYACPVVRKEVQEMPIKRQLA